LKNETAAENFRSDFDDACDDDDLLNPNPRGRRMKGIHPQTNPSELGKWVSPEVLKAIAESWTSG